MLQVVWMKPCIMSSPWLENRRSRLCLLWAERLSDDASTNSCLSAWLGFLTFPELRLDSAILKIETLLISYLIKWLFFVQSLFNQLVSLTEEARKAYKDMVSALEQEQTEEALKNEKKVPHQMGHYRNHSAASAVSFCSIFSEPISEVNEKEYGKL